VPSSLAIQNALADQGRRWGFLTAARGEILNTTSMLLLAWLIPFDFPEHATCQPGVFGALISAAITAFAVADYRPLRGAPLTGPRELVHERTRVVHRWVQLAA
jgi:hypothetical protein